jgi:hypothetical protein
MTNKSFTHLASSNNEIFQNTQPSDLLFYSINPQSKIHIGSSNTSNYVTIGASSTSINNTLVAANDILPAVTLQSDIGSSNRRFKDAFINNVNASLITITETNQEVTQTTTDTFTIESATEISLNAPLTTIQGDLVPLTDSFSYLGTSNIRFKEAWIDTVHIGPNTLYIGDTPVLGTDADTITIKADENQSILVNTTGSGVTNVQSVKGVNLFASGPNSTIDIESTKGINMIATGLNSVVDVKATGAGGSVVFGATSQVTFTSPQTTFSSNMTVQGNTTIQGNLIVNGTNFIVNTQDLVVKDNIIVLNSGQLGNGVTAGKAGISIDRGDLNNFLILFDESDDKLKIGTDIETLKPLATSVSPTFTGTITASNINTTGNVGIGLNNPSEPLHVNGNILATGDVTAESDSRLKKNLRVIEDAMSKIKQLNGYTYEMIKDEKNKRHVGLVAQEVQAILPEAVNEADDDAKTLSLAYGNLIALLVEGMKEQEASLTEIKKVLGM